MAHSANNYDVAGASYQEGGSKRHLITPLVQ